MQGGYERRPISVMCKTVVHVVKVEEAEALEDVETERSAAATSGSDRNARSRLVPWQGTTSGNAGKQVAGDISLFVQFIRNMRNL